MIHISSQYILIEAVYCSHSVEATAICIQNQQCIWPMYFSNVLVEICVLQIVKHKIHAQLGQQDYLKRKSARLQS